MRRTLPAIALVLLLAPDASAQPVAAEQPTVPMQAEIAARASFDTSYLLALYMAQLAAAGAPSIRHISGLRVRALPPG
jgi:hypothetical protein